MPRVHFFTSPKLPDHNEDFFIETDNTYVLVDGATSKSGKSFGGKSGGEIISRLIANACVSTRLTGVALVKMLNEQMRKKYDQLGLTDISDPINRFAGGFICVRLTKSKLHITYLGDLGFRINGQIPFQEIKQIDSLIADKRAEYIKKSSDIAGSRDYIMQDLIGQLSHQNNSGSPLGYGVIDGSETPEKFVRTFEYVRSEVHTLELFTDGYVLVPSKSELEAWEMAYHQSKAQDPDRYLHFRSTKSEDDRSVVIIHFEECA